MAYLLVFLSGGLVMASALGIARMPTLTPLLEALMIANAASLAWRAALRGLFTGREHGLEEGVRAIARIPISNIIAIMAGRRAVAQYVGSLRGGVLHWDKTEHRDHPSIGQEAVA